MESNYRSCSSTSPSSRIAIDSLLNPTGNSGKLTEKALQDYEANGQPHEHHHKPPYHLYQTSQFVPVQYNHNQRHPLEGHADLSPSDRRTGSATGSANGSPVPYFRGDRFPSASSCSSTAPERRRAPRPKYEEEEMYFIWYHRVDLGQEWRQVRENFNAQFPNRQRSGFQGIQCKFYRFIKEKRCPTLRDQKQQENQRGKGGSRNSPGDDGPAYGVLKWTGVWFPWMKEPPPESRHRA